MNVIDFEINNEVKGAFFENAHSPFIILNNNMTFVGVNQAGVETLGISKKNFLGKNILDIFPNLEGTERYDAYRNVIKTGVPFTYDELTFKSEGGDAKFMVRAFKIGDYLGITTLDVTKVLNTIEKLKTT